jgi:hypothetical protein
MGVGMSKEIDNDNAHKSIILVVNEAHRVAKAMGFGRGKGGRFTFECPICKGTVTCSVASYNGHIHGSCDTENCARWME